MCSVAFQRKNTTLTICRRCERCYKDISTQNPRRFRRDLSSLPLKNRAMLYAAQLGYRTMDYASSAAYCKGPPLHSGL
jgi:ribosomal protein L34E